MEHTKGPWRHIAFGKSISIDAPDYIGLAFLNPFGARTEGIPDRRDIANAHLIDAAPKMLEALEGIDSYLTDLLSQTDSSALDNLEKARRGHCQQVNNVMAAIAKVRG